MSERNTTDPFHVWVRAEVMGSFCTVVILVQNEGLSQLDQDNTHMW